MITNVCDPREKMLNILYNVHSTCTLYMYNYYMQKNIHCPYMYRVRMMQIVQVVYIYSVYITCLSFPLKYTCHCISHFILGYIHVHVSMYACLIIVLSCWCTLQVYLVDYGLVCRYRPQGKHKEYKEDPRRKHDGTLEFTSIDAHKGVCEWYYAFTCTCTCTCIYNVQYCTYVMLCIQCL